MQLQIRIHAKTNGCIRERVKSNRVVSVSLECHQIETALKQPVDPLVVGGKERYRKVRLCTGGGVHGWAAPPTSGLIVVLTDIVN